MTKNERKGRWTGEPDNIGDKLTYFIYCLDTHKILSKSVIRSEDPH